MSALADVAPPALDSASPRTPRGRARIEQAIREAAIVEFGRHGFRGASTQAIAVRAGLTKPQLHYYIQSKQALYETLLYSVLDDWASAFAFETAAESPREVLARYVRRKLDYAIDHPGLSRLFTSEVLGGGEHLDRYWPRARQTTDDKVRVIERWIADGRLRPLDARLLLMQIWAMTQHYADYAVQARVMLGLPAGAPFEREPIARELTAFVLRGCGLAPD